MSTHSGAIKGWESCRDYYPFGMEMPGRSYEAGDYRFGFQGIEFENAVLCESGSYTTDYRLYNPSIGRWISQDPVTHFSQSPYSAFDNAPIIIIDPLGSDGDPANVAVYIGNDQKTIEAMNGTLYNQWQVYNFQTYNDALDYIRNNYSGQDINLFWLDHGGFNGHSFNIGDGDALVLKGADISLFNVQRAYATSEGVPFTKEYFKANSAAYADGGISDAKVDLLFDLSQLAMNFGPNSTFVFGGCMSGGAPLPGTRSEASPFIELFPELLGLSGKQSLFMNEALTSGAGWESTTSNGSKFTWSVYFDVPLTHPDNQEQGSWIKISWDASVSKAVIYNTGMILQLNSQGLPVSLVPRGVKPDVNRVKSKSKTYQNAKQ